MPPRSFQTTNRDIALQIKGGRRYDTVINEITTGGGKASLPVIYSSTLIPHTADRVCWIVPRDSLRSAAVDEFNEKWLIDWLGVRREIRAAVNEIDPSRGTNGYVTTYQAVVQNPEMHRDEFKCHRYILILDEPHHVEENGLWHHALKPLVEHAQLVVLMSGTLERGDDRHIAFLEYCQRCQDGKTGETFDTSETPTRRYVHYSRTDALADSAIIPITFTHCDLAGSWVDRDGKKVSIGSFREIDDDQSGDALYTGLSTGYAAQLLADCARDWVAYSATHKSSRLLVIAHRQYAAKQYVAMLKETFGIQAGIAVSDDGREAKKEIKRFRRGEIPALVTVGMAYEGLNVPGISHEACLTHIRSKPWIEQMLGRLVRVDPKAGEYGQQKGRAYVPDDPLMCEVIEQIKIEQAPFIQDRRTGQHGGGGSVDLGGIVALGGGISGLRFSDLDGTDEMAQGEASLYRAVLERLGLTGKGLTELDIRRLLMTVAAVDQEGAPAFTVREPTINEEENKLRSDIQDRCSVIDYAHRREFGATNGEVIRRFGKPRGAMTVPELRSVWAYLNRKYPEYSDANVHA